jgi:hypothetical protein
MVRMDAKNMETSMEEKVVLKEAWIEHEGERRRIDRLEKILEEVFQTILDSVLTG